MAGDGDKLAQKVFKKIVLHNKLADEQRIDEELARSPNPEHVIRTLVSDGTIKSKVGYQLLELYRGRLAKVRAEAADHAASETAVQKREPETKPTPAAAPEPPSPAEKQTEPEEKQPAAEQPKAPAKVQVRANGDGRKLAHQLLKAAREANASDVHITSEQVPVMRVAGRMQQYDMPPMSHEQCEQALLSLLNDEQRAHFDEHRDIDFCYDGGEELGRFRTNFFVEQNGMDGVFRLIATKPPRFEDLNLPDTVKMFTEYRVGIVLVTGPKSCGKTTTLAAMVDLVNSSRKEHIITIEDPIEFVHHSKQSHISQREVGSHTREFSNALRAALREAPDVIMVGEMRDLETTSLAITAAETGHLVLATLHTPDAARTIGRVLDVFPPKEQGQIRAMLSESLRGIVSQQLVPNPDGTGMELALEILVNTPAIGNLIREDRTFQLRGIMQTGRKLGMCLMDESLLKLVEQGRITKETAVTSAADQNFVRKELGMKVEKEEAPA